MKKPNLKAKMFGGPIPGQSLTGEPKSKPWERPPEMTDVNDIISFYIDRTSNPSAAKKFLFMMEEGVPVRPIVQSILTSGQSKGLHSIDASLLVAPALHEHFVAMADDAGIDYKEGLEDPRDAEIDKEINKARVYKRLKKISKDGKSNVKTEEDTTKIPEAPEEPPKEKPKGLATRRNK